MLNTISEKKEEVSLMDKKSEFRIKPYLGDCLNGQFVQKEGEDINRQVSFDFHTCFDAKNLFVQAQETGLHIRKHTNFLAL